MRALHLRHPIKRDSPECPPLSVFENPESFYGIRVLPYHSFAVLSIKSFPIADIFLYIKNSLPKTAESFRLFRCHGDLLGRDGKLAKPLAGGVVHRVGDRRERRVDDDLADGLCAVGPGLLVACLEFDGDTADVLPRRDLILHEGVFRRHAAAVVGDVFRARHAAALQ